MSMRLKPYPSYKDSGVEWLGRIPVHWHVVRSDAVLEYRKEQARRESFSGKRVFHYSIPAIQETGDGREEDGAEIDSDKISLSGDELLVSKLNPRKGCVLISKMRDLPVICSTEFVPLKAKRCDLRFAFYLYASQPVRELISATVQSVTRSHQRANPADIAKIWLAFPSDAEQQSIATFLDRETGKIDALVAKKERLIELLQERRTALINHAVTQGLNPNAPKKDSSIPWLGRIPAHWEVVHLKRCLRSTDYGISDSTNDVGEFKVLTMANVQNGELDFDGVGFVDAVDPQLILEADDLLFNRTNSLELVGKVAIFRGRLQDAVTFASYLVRLRVNQRVLPEYLNYVLNCEGCLGLARSMALLSINQANLNPNRYGFLRVVLPPIGEQPAIVSHLKAQTAKLDALMAKVRAAIERLQEYRTGLISAAVTGQIDVRGEAKP